MNKTLLKRTSELLHTFSWKEDLLAGLQVSVVSLPLSMGIAIASGAPPIAGLISAIVAGFVYPFLGGSFVTISGPAAGLAPIILAGIHTLGRGDAIAGYKLVLVAIFFAGYLQCFLSYLPVRKILSAIPQVVAESMLVAIGLILIAKQLPPLFGVSVPANEHFIEYIVTLFAYAHLTNLKVLVVGLFCLGLVLAVRNTRLSRYVRIPPYLLVVLVAVMLSSILSIESRFFINLPDNVVTGITFPDFAKLFDKGALLIPVFIIVVQLMLVDGIESLATVSAIDTIDPLHRRSSARKTIRAMGVSNMLSSLVGGLTVIPGGIKSKVNVDAGGKTLNANLYNAFALSVFLAFGRPLIERIPYSALAALLIYIGIQMVKPALYVVQKGWGNKEKIVLLSTVVSIVLTDVLVGVVFGALCYHSLVFLKKNSFGKKVKTNILNSEA